MNNNRITTSSLVYDLIFIGDVAMGLDETYDESESPADKMRQAAMMLVYNLIADQIDNLKEVDTLLELALIELERTDGSELVIEKLKTIGDILFRTGPKSENEEEDDAEGDEEAEDEDAEDDAGDA